MCYITYIDLDSKAFRPRGWPINTAILLRSSLESENWETVLSEALFREAIIIQTTARQQDNSKAASNVVGWNSRDTRPLPWKRYHRINMSRQLCAEAVLCNILHYFNSTKHKRNGVSIASRDFLLSIAFHKRSFQTMGWSSREISEAVSVNRNTLLPHLGNATPLENIILQPYKKESASNDWRKREVLLQLVDHFLLLYKWFPVDLSTCTNVCMKGGEQMVREVDSHWMENLTASPNKKDIVTLHVKGKGLHLYVPKPDGSLKYTCVENSGCKRHQRYFQSSSTKALFKTFIQQYPLRRGMQH